MTTASDAAIVARDDLPLMLTGETHDETSLLPLRSRRLDWAALLRRVYRFDVLHCPQCAEPMHVVAAISEPNVIAKILQHLGLPSAVPDCAPARAPPEMLDFDRLELHH